MRIPSSPPLLIPLLASSLVLAGCDSPSAAANRTCGSGTVELQVGEAAEGGGGACDLGTAPGAVYALAYADGRSIALAESGTEPYRPDGVYAVTVTDALGQEVNPARAPSRLPSPEMDADWHVDAQTGPRTYAGASGGEDGWTVGEVITLSDACQDGDCTQPGSRVARVARVYDGGLVVAAVEDEVGSTLAPMLALLDEAVPFIEQHGLPLMKAVFTDGAPVVSAPGGSQLLVVLEAGRTTASARAFSRLGPGGEPLTIIRMEPFAARGLGSTTSLLAHEMTHGYQWAYMVRTRSAGVETTNTGTALWGVEGGANLISYETIRRAAGLPLAGNYDFRAPGGGSLEAYYALRAQPPNGELTAGYDGAMGFFRDLVIRRVESGEGVDAAVREVSRGVVEGWHGRDRHGSRREGLAARMRSRIGGWEPADALLTWTLSHAGDDRTGNPLYQDRASLRVWDAADPEYGWFPAAVLQGGGTAVATTLAGSPGYVIVRDTGAGVSVRVDASIPGLHWRVLRIG